MKDTLILHIYAIEGMTSLNSVEFDNECELLPIQESVFSSNGIMLSQNLWQNNVRRLISNS